VEEKTDWGPLEPKALGKERRKKERKERKKRRERRYQSKGIDSADKSIGYSAINWRGPDGLRKMVLSER
jgi:hypothetical protein